jgi:hypothetical protein
MIRSQMKVHNQLPAVKSTKFFLGRYAVAIFVALLLLNALDAYNIGPIPLPWLANIGFIAIFLILGFTDKIHIMAEDPLFLFLFGWAFLVTCFNSLVHDYASLMPELATTPYLAFIALRFLTFLAFMATTHFVYWLLIHGYRDQVIEWTVRLGTVISIAAIYIYIAQTHGLPEFPRNRLGTAGEKQPITFSYAFHRAEGTFREPGLLAEWLVVPFFLSFTYPKKFSKFHTLVIGFTILLTGSLAGILGILLGIVAGLLIMNPLQWNNIKTLIKFGPILIICLAIFHFAVVKNVSERNILIQVVSERVAPILFEGGMKATDRDYVYNYVSHTDIPYIGRGIGNSNLLFSQYLSANDISSFLSLYLNFMFSTGILGLILLSGFLVPPLLRVAFNKRKKKSRDVLWIMAAYIAWLIIFGVQSEEFTLMFAIIFSFLSYETNAKISEYKRS